VKRTILSKDFKGGRISNVFGSTELDLSSADINGIAVLDLSLAFGEIVITVPCDWHIDADLSQFMATVEDNRDNVYQTTSTSKVLMLRGSSTCGLVEIQHNC
jgi:hypothetical protein